MSYPPLPSNGETNWGTKFRTWADALEGQADALQGSKVEGSGMSLRRDTTVGERIFLDYPGGTTMLYGDTGWRSVASSLDARWTGALAIRRINDQIFLRSWGVTPSGTPSSPYLYKIPVGFTSTNGEIPINAKLTGDNQPVSARVNTSNTYLDDTVSPTTARSVMGTWLTPDSWPTTLP